MAASCLGVMARSYTRERTAWRRRLSRCSPTRRRVAATASRRWPRFAPTPHGRRRRRGSIRFCAPRSSGQGQASSDSSVPEPRHELLDANGLHEGRRPLALATGQPPAPSVLAPGQENANSIVPVDALHALVTLLGLDGEGGDRAGLQSAEADRLAGLLAIAVCAGLDAEQRLVDLGNQLTGTVAGAQLEGPVRLDTRAVGDVGLVDAPLGEAGQRPVRLAEQIGTPS